MQFTLKYLLAKFRKRLEFSQTYLAKKVSVSRQTISAWESGLKVPNLKHLETLCDVFHLNASEKHFFNSAYAKAKSVSDSRRGRPKKIKKCIDTE
jgi:DNA-binding XRE family transcriptional regulator